MDLLKGCDAGALTELADPTTTGLVRMLVFWHPTERRMAVLHLATSAEALQAVTEALPGTLSPTGWVRCVQCGYG